MEQRPAITISRETGAGAISHTALSLPGGLLRFSAILNVILLGLKA